MKHKETYSSPLTEVVQAFEAFNLLINSPYDGGDIENPIDYGEWN